MSDVESKQSTRLNAEFLREMIAGYVRDVEPVATSQGLANFLSAELSPVAEQLEEYREALVEIAEIVPMIGCLDGPECNAIARRVLGLESNQDSESA